MRKFKENLDQLQLLLENKDHLIDRLDLTDEQKEELKSFFKAHPNYENKIDWNNKALTYEDFRPVLDLEGKSRNSVKKYGLSGKAQIADLIEGTDYETINQTDTYTVYYVKTFKGSEVLARPSTPPAGVTGKWCIAGRNYSPGTDDHHWKTYTDNGYKFFFVFNSKTKYALCCKISLLDQAMIDPGYAFQCFNKNDNQVSSNKWPQFIQHAVQDILNSKNIKVIAAQAKEEQERQEQLKKKNTEALKQEITRVIRDLSKGYIDPKYTREYYSSDRTSSAVFDGDLELNFWETLFPEGQPINSKEIDYPEICRFIRSLEVPIIKIPDNITVIGKNCFHGFEGLKAIQIPESIRVIEYKAFAESGIRSIVIPKTVCFIRDGVFSNCQYLESVKFEGEIFYKKMLDDQRILPPSIFMNCYSLQNITLPKNIQEILLWAFWNCYSLKKINIPDSVKKISSQAFGRCTSLREIHWPAELQEIGTEAFKDCKALNEIILPDSVQEIKDVAFSGCICDKVVLPGSLKLIFKRSLEDLYTKKLIFKGTEQQWFNLLVQDHSRFGTTWYQGNIKPVLEFQPEN